GRRPAPRARPALRTSRRRVLPDPRRADRTGEQLLQPRRLAGAGALSRPERPLQERLQPRSRQPATAQPGFPIAAEAAPTGQAGQRLDVSIARDGVAKTSARARRILGIRRAPLARHLAAIARPNSYTAGHASRDIAHATTRCDNAFAFL